MTITNLNELAPSEIDLDCLDGFMIFENDNWWFAQIRVHHFQDVLSAGGNSPEQATRLLAMRIQPRCPFVASILESLEILHVGRPYPGTHTYRLCINGQQLWKQTDSHRLGYNLAALFERVSTPG